MGQKDLVPAVDALLDELVDSGTEVGLQVAVIQDGRTIVDAVRGRADPRTGAPAESDTLFWAGSTAKGVATSVAHVLIEQGDLHPDLRVADVWPEFAARGKGATTLRHVLLHTAGVPGLPPDTTAEDLCNWDHMCAVIAEAEPWWTPGSRFGYHAKTFGFLLGEVLRRATGATISTLLRERITSPLGVADEVHFAVPAQLLPRVDGVRLVSPGRLASMAEVVFTGPDEVMGFPTSWAYGYAPSRPNGHGRPGSSFGMIGMNGSAAYADIDSGLAVAVMRNCFSTGDITTIARLDQLVADELA